ncbi:hypothetical protein Gotur_016230, partial [Gossypium turneri]
IVQNTPNLKEPNSEQQTAIGSSNVPNTPDEPAEIQTESGGTRRGRGRTLLKDLYELNPVERVKVSKNKSWSACWIRSSTFSRIFGHYSMKCQYVAYQLRVMASNA